MAVLYAQRHIQDRARNGTHDGDVSLCDIFVGHWFDELLSDANET
jgi:hypothetical protein